MGYFRGLRGDWWRKLARLGIASLLVMVLAPVLLATSSTGCTVCDSRSFCEAVTSCIRRSADDCDTHPGCHKSMACTSRCTATSASECETVAGCKWNPAAFCDHQGLSCFNLSESDCGQHSNCAWQPSCDGDGDCDYDQAECGARSYCRWTTQENPCSLG